MSLKTSRGIIYQYEDGGTYCGEWEKDSAHGHGCGTGPGGQGKFEGCWKNGDQVSGVYTWPQGMKYTGQWKENQRDGLGKETREDGSEYCGEFTRGARGTYGVIKLANGTYKGSWRNGKQDGEGEEVYVDGGCYRGQYKNGLRCGYGTRTSAAYEAGQKELSGKCQDPSKQNPLSSLVVPIANMKKNSIASTVSLPTSTDGTASEASATNHKPVSQIYEGEWKNDKRHGYGVIKCIGSYTYYGQWDNNSRTGYGVLVYENGTKEEGQWQCGQLIMALKRRKINLKSHQLESKVQAAHTQAIQAADAARNKALLAESRSNSASAKSKMAQVVAVRAEKDAALAREKAELYKNAPRISENIKSPIQDPSMSPSHLFQMKEHPGLSHLNPGLVSYSPSLDNLQGTMPHSVSSSLYESGSGSDSDSTDHGMERQTSGRSTSSSRASTRSSVDYNTRRHKASYPLETQFYIGTSTESNYSLPSRRSSDGSVKEQSQRVALQGTRSGSLPGVLKEECEGEEDIEELEDVDWGKGREGTMARKRKRDKTTGELEQSSDEEERAARAKMSSLDAKALADKPRPLESKHSVAMEMLVNNLNQMANWNKMIAYVNFFLLIFLMILILVVVGSMYYYQLVSFYHNHQVVMASSEGSANYGSFSLDSSSFGTHSSSFPSTSLPSTDDYLDIDDILATEQMVPVEFVTTVYRLGFLNPSSADEDLREGLKMDLPFWLAKRLATRTTNRMPIVSIDLPSCYKKKQRDILSADANVVDLYGKEPYYYLLGLKLVQCNHLESMDLSQSLLETFLNRFRKIMDHSQNSFQTDTYTTTCKLDETERKLFKVGQEGANGMEKWGRGASHKLTSSNARKRKRRPSR